MLRMIADRVHCLDRSPDCTELSKGDRADEIAGPDTRAIAEIPAVIAPKKHYIRKLKSCMLAKNFPPQDRMLRILLIAEAGLNVLIAEIETYIGYRGFEESAIDMDPRKIF